MFNKNTHTAGYHGTQGTRGHIQDSFGASELVLRITDSIK